MLEMTIRFMNIVNNFYFFRALGRLEFRTSDLQITLRGLIIAGLRWERARERNYNSLI